MEKPSRNDILKVMLADECDFTCPYSGESFSMAELLHGGLVHIEHIIPYSRSFDDSFANKTLCVNRYNAAKSNKTPYEAFGNSSEYPQMIARVKKFKGVYVERKLELFKMQEVEPTDFLERNLNDTRYASKLAMQYLAKLYGGIVDKAGKKRIYAIAGGCTALVRRSWGGNYLLGEGEKVRSDHRHHAIDAMTIALTTPHLVQKIAGMSTEYRQKLKDEEPQFIDNQFYQQACSMLEQCAVTHHTLNKMRGAFHKETIYSKDYSNGDSIRHERIKLSDLDENSIQDIVDPAIKRIILDKLGIIDEKTADKKELKENLKMFNDDPDYLNYPRMIDRDGNEVNVIKKVRVARHVNTRSIGKGDGKREVANGSNYVLAIFAKLNEKGEETAWEGEVVSLLDAVLRKQRKQEIFVKDRPGMKFKFSLQKGDIVKFTKDGEEKLCVIRGLAAPQSPGRSPEFQCCPVNDARMKKDIIASGCWYRPTVTAAYKWKMCKYNMNIFGELQRAND